MHAPDRDDDDPNVPFGDAVRAWSRIAILSFGGPAAQIALMHRILVEEKKWISEASFLHALNYCMLLPGPEAQQLATYIGWLLHRTAGGLIAGILFILPGFLAMLALSVLYTAYHQLPLVEAIFLGMKPAVLAIVLQAVLRIGTRILRTRVLVALAVASFVAMFFFDIPFPVILIAAALVGVIGGRVDPEWFSTNHGPAVREVDSRDRTRYGSLPSPSIGRSLRVAALCGALWFVPLVALVWRFGTDSIFVQEHLFFSKVAMVTFGGAYSVLAYVAQQAVETFEWLSVPEMLDGLGMAETTPGPLIMVVQFVGYLGAYRNPGELSPVTAGILGAVVTTWVTFVPCFLWIFLGAPYVERLRQNRSLTHALTAVTAAVVGVILNLAVWFAIHVLFSDVPTSTLGPLRLPTPILASIQWWPAVIAVVATVMTLFFKRGIFQTLLVGILLGVAGQALQ